VTSFGFQLPKVYHCYCKVGEARALFMVKYRRDSAAGTESINFSKTGARVWQKHRNKFCKMLIQHNCESINTL